MTAAAGLLGFGAVADGSLGDYDSTFFEIVSETAPASETPAALAVLAITTADAGAAADAASSQAALVAASTEAGSAADASTGLAIFPGAIAETNAASDAQSGSAVFPNAVSDAGSANDAPSNVVAFNPSQTETVTATDAATSAAAFLNAHSEAGSANDTPSSLAVLLNAYEELSPANDNVSSALVTRPSQSETVAASDAATAAGVFVAGATESITAGDNTTVQVGISIIEGGISVDLNDDSLLGFGALGGGALAAYGGLIIEVANDSFTVTVAYNPSIIETGAASETLAPSNIITFSRLEILTVTDLVIGEYGFNFIYDDTEIMCVRSEPRIMRVGAQWKASVDPEAQDARANPDYKPRAETRKRAC